MAKIRSEYAKVIAINDETGFVAVELDSGDISVFEKLVYFELEIGNLVYGRFTTTGIDSIFRHQIQRSHEVDVIATGCTKDNYFHHMSS
ncbi:MULTISPECIES: hypothetical protein [Shewanella]|uniref:hypothetical protein n=1 Tax=Shewanella TaxID=22 RepID=UPI0014315667|nr:MULTISPECIES: hypothetical protein [Shewanella]MBO2684969.1 hypothetical protein [Shewanella algae]NJI82859.1 hypothetical protein [Shewanella sp. Iso12]